MRGDIPDNISDATTNPYPNPNPNPNPNPTGWFPHYIT